MVSQVAPVEIVELAIGIAVREAQLYSCQTTMKVTPSRRSSGAHPR